MPIRSASAWSGPSGCFRSASCWRAAGGIRPERAQMSEPKEFASPACSADEADDAYMGFASRAEIAAFLKELEAAEHAGRPHAEMLRRMLPKVRDDVLHRELSAKLKAQESVESKT